MTRVALTGWVPGLNKVALIKLVRTHADLGLRDAKHLVDDLLAGEPAVVTFDEADQARVFLERARALGALARMLHGE
jgi:ribosomal protein L7/L12